jgi:hypothetical protein
MSQNDWNVRAHANAPLGVSGRSAISVVPRGSAGNGAYAGLG